MIFFQNPLLYTQKKHTELNKQLQVQLSGLREEHQTVLSCLKEAHSLLEKHVEASNKAQEGEVHYAPLIINE